MIDLAIIAFSGAFTILSAGTGALLLASIGVVLVGFALASVVALLLAAQACVRGKAL